MVSVASRVQRTRLFGLLEGEQVVVDRLRALEVEHVEQGEGPVRVVVGVPPATVVVDGGRLGLDQQEQPLLAVGRGVVATGTGQRDVARLLARADQLDRPPERLVVESCRRRCTRPATAGPEVGGSSTWWRS